MSLKRNQLMKDKLDVILMLMASMRPSSYSFEGERTIRAKAFLKINREYLIVALQDNAEFVGLLEAAFDASDIDLAIQIWGKIQTTLQNRREIANLKN